MNADLAKRASRSKAPAERSDGPGSGNVRWFTRRAKWALGACAVVAVISVGACDDEGGSDGENNMVQTAPDQSEADQAQTRAATGGKVEVDVLEVRQIQDPWGSSDSTFGERHRVYAVSVTIRNETGRAQTPDFYLEGGTVTRVKGIALDEIGNVKDVAGLWPRELSPDEERTGEVLFGYLKTDPPAERFVVIDATDGATLFSTGL